MSDKKNETIIDKIKLMSRPKLALLSILALGAVGTVTYVAVSSSQSNYTLTTENSHDKESSDTKGTNPETDKEEGDSTSKELKEGNNKKNAEKKGEEKDLAESVLKRYDVSPVEISPKISSKDSESNLRVAKAEQTLLNNKPAVVETVKPIEPEKPQEEITKPVDNDDTDPPIVTSTPVIQVSSSNEIVLVKGEDFDISNYYAVSDSMDRLPNIRINGNVDNQRVGQQLVEIEATNMYGNSARKTLTFYVDEPAQFEKIKETNDIMIESETFEPLSFIKATHHLDGDVTAKTTVISNNVNLEKEGRYEIEYKVVDSKNISSFYTVEFLVTNHAPKLIGVKDLSFDVGTDLTTELLLQGVSATDREDDALKRDLVVTIDEEQLKAIDSSVAGDYDLTYKVVDSHGKETSQTVKVSLIEKEKEEDKGAEEIPETSPEENKNERDEDKQESIATYSSGKHYTVTRYTETRTDTVKPYEIKK